MKIQEIKKFDAIKDTCSICNSKNIYQLLTDHMGITIYKCRSCKTQFMNPQYTDIYLQNLYNEYQEIDFKVEDYESLKRKRILVHHYNLAQIEQYVKNGNFLSVGCGKGIDLEVAKERGWFAEGQDMDCSSTDKIARNLQIKVSCGDFSKLPYQKNYYDCVYMNHVIEHPKNPGKYLQKINEVLKDRGILYISCPNFSSLSAKVKKIPEWLGIKKNVGSYYDTWQHLFYYNPGQLKNVLEKIYGFKVIYIGNDKRARSENTEIKRYMLDKIPYKAAFRLLAMKVNSPNKN